MYMYLFKLFSDNSSDEKKNYLLLKFIDLFSFFKMRYFHKCLSESRLYNRML